MRRSITAAASKCLIAGLLAICFLVDPIVGSFTWLQFRKGMVKKEVDKHLVSGIEHNDLVLLRFSKEDTQTLLRWEHPREFEYDGQMYDVVETWTLGDEVYLRCWWDREETKLNSRLRELAARALGDAPKIGERGDPWNSSPKSSSFTLTREWNVPPPESSAMRMRADSDSYPSVAIRPPTPPPRPV